MTEERDGLEQNMYAAWLDAMSWVAGETKYRLLGAAGSPRGIYEMGEGQLAALMGLQGCERFLQHRKNIKPQSVWGNMGGSRRERHRLYILPGGVFSPKACQDPRSAFWDLLQGKASRRQCARGGGDRCEEMQ